MRRITQLKTKSFLGLLASMIFLSACNSGFNVNTEMMANASAAVDPYTAPEKQCQISGPGQMRVGDVAELGLQLNFNLPAGSQLSWIGTDNGTAIQISGYTQEGVSKWTIKYGESSIPGTYSRYLKILSPNGQTMCVSNTISIELLRSSLADRNCVALGGKLNSNLCAIEQWTLYRAMSERNIPVSGTTDGGANPASLNCARIGGSPTLDGICTIDEDKLMSIIKVVN